MKVAVITLSIFVSCSMPILRFLFSLVVEVLRVCFYSGLTYQTFDNLCSQVAWLICASDDIVH
jgi:hypothetical protein